MPAWTMTFTEAGEVMPRGEPFVMTETEWTERGKRLSESLVLAGFPVGVKMIEDRERLDAIQYKGRPVRKVDKALAGCQLISQARYLGRVIAGEEKSLKVCRLGADVLGFDVDDYSCVYTNTYFEMEEAARHMIETTPKFEKGMYHAILVGPLQKMPVEPDVVIVYGNAAQMLPIITGYLHDKGGRLQFSASGAAALCADTIVLPMSSNQPHLAIPCNGGRILSLPSLTDLACGIPYGLLEDVLEGIAFTARNVPLMYPTGWQHIDWELRDDAPVRAFLQRKKT